MPTAGEVEQKASLHLFGKERGEHVQWVNMGNVFLFELIFLCSLVVCNNMIIVTQEVCLFYGLMFKLE